MPREVTVRKHHFVPKQYYHAVMYALTVFRSGKSLTDSVTIAAMMFNKPPNKERLKEDILRRHLIKWIASD